MACHPLAFKGPNQGWVKRARELRLGAAETAASTASQDFS